MTKQKKFMTAGIAVGIAATLAVGATLAYLGSTQTVVNNLTFVPGATMAALTEPSFVPSDALNLEPGTNVSKNPQITNIMGLSIGDATDPNGLNSTTGNTGIVIGKTDADTTGNLVATDQTFTSPSKNLTEFAMLQLEFQGVNYNPDGSTYTFDLQPWQINELMQVISFNSSTAADNAAAVAPATAANENVGLDLTDWSVDTNQAAMDAAGTTFTDATAAPAAGANVTATNATPNYVDYIYNTPLDSYYTDGNGNIVNATPGTTNPLFDSFTVNASANDQQIADILAWAPGGINIVTNAAVVQTDNLKIGDSAISQTTPSIANAPLVSDAALTALEGMLPIASTAKLSALGPNMVSISQSALLFAQSGTRTTSEPETYVDNSVVPPVTLYTSGDVQVPTYDWTPSAYSATNYTNDIAPTNTTVVYAPVAGDQSLY